MSAVVLLSIAFIVAPVNAAKNGGSCRNAGLTVVTEGVTFKCKKSNGKLKWVSTKTKPIPVTISNTRITSDRVDDVTGFQVKAIYVVPSDGVDHSYDTNGDIAKILDEGNKYLRVQLGLQVPIDKHVVGYDIQYLKSSLTSEFLRKAIDPLAELFSESKVLDDPGLNRKNYIFFVDVDRFLNGTSCGRAALPGISAFVAIGNPIVKDSGSCKTEATNFNDNIAATTWVHELFHNFGVGHTTNDPCDLMAGSETPGFCRAGKQTIDKERSGYVGSAVQGQDILRLRVWEGSTNKLDLEADCSINPVPRADGFEYAYCPTGTQTIGILKNCGYQTDSVTLEEFVDGRWTSLGAGSLQLESWGPKLSRSYGKCPEGFPGSSKQLTVTTPGTSLYRWMVNGTESEQFKVIWVR